jgi:hypothetical protein
MGSKLHIALSLKIPFHVFDGSTGQRFRRPKDPITLGTSKTLKDPLEFASHVRYCLRPAPHALQVDANRATAFWQSVAVEPHQRSISALASGLNRVRSILT